VATLREATLSKREAAHFLRAPAQKMSREELCLLMFFRNHRDRIARKLFKTAMIEVFFSWGEVRMRAVVKTNRSFELGASLVLEFPLYCRFFISLKVLLRR